ncbi:MAG TPA: ROK family protein [Steroidobacteraceae bacterium]|jgi:fructokinase|nr:ROK family protein [Steroidobacteraceae bacterium]
MTAAKALLAGVELGGTKCVCVIGTGPGDIRGSVSVPTASDAQATLARLGAALVELRAAHGEFAALGLASFGPLDLDLDSETYGRIERTPKEGWSGVDVLGFFSRLVAGTVGVTTDVIAAALAEGRWGAARGCADYAYVTVGTGIGVGVIMGARPLIGGHHPELGHIRIARAPGDRWPGSCRFHGDCLEGLASGPAIAARSGASPADLAPDEPVWDGVAHALVQLAHNLVLSFAPRRILFGGGVALAQPGLLPRIRSGLAASLGDYLDLERLSGGVDALILPAGLGALAGPSGALAVAAEALAPR